MPSCVLRTCKNHSRSKVDDVKFHKFPPRGDKRLKAWTKFVQLNRKDDLWFPTKASCICSIHFKESDIIFSSTGRTYLTKAAVPYYHTQKSDNTEITEPISETVSDSDSVSVLETKLAQEIAARKKLAVRYQNAQDQIRFLKRKCERYKSMIKGIKLNLDLIVSKT